MAEVFLAYIEHKGKKKPVAIKRMLPQMLRDKELEEQFIAEGRLLEQLHHPNIVETIELGKFKDSLFIAMEYVFGASVDDLLRSSKKQGIRIPLNLLARIGADVCDVLAYIHRFSEQDGSELRYIHRDISPQNIMLSYSGQVKVMDFGIAQDLGTMSRTRPVALAGKVAYMSPEQVKQAPDLDLRTDVYSLGTVLFELSLGSKPYSAKTELDTMLAIVKNPVPDLRDLDDEIPDEFAEIIAKSMEKDRQKRYQDASEFRTALDGFLSRRNAAVSPRDLAVFIRRVLPPQKTQSAQQKKKIVQKNSAPATAQDPAQSSGPQPHEKKEKTKSVDRDEIKKPDEPVIVLTKKISQVHQVPQGEPAPQSAQIPEKKIDLSESEMFASLAPESVKAKPKKLRIASLGLIAGCSLAGLLYWFLYTPGRVQQEHAPDNISKPQKTETLPKAPNGPNSSESLPVQNRVDQKNNKLRHAADTIGHGPSGGAEYQKKQTTKKTSKSESRTSQKAQKASQPIPEIEIEMEPEEKKPLPVRKDAPSADKYNKDEEKPLQSSLATPPEKAKSASTENQAGKENTDSAVQASKTEIKKRQEPPPKPSYQAPEVVAKRRIAGSDPAYPPMARKAKLRATVLVKIHISPDGKVGFMKILKGNPLFNDAVSKAIRTWRFSPYTINGRPVGTYTVYKFVFQID